MTNANGWKLELRKSYQVEYITQQSTYKEWIPIPPIVFDSTYTKILIGGFSETAKPWWYLAGFVEQQSYSSPSFTFPFNQPILVEQSKKVPLGKLVELTFGNPGYSIYRYSFEPRYYLQDITIEIWTPQQ